MFWLAWSTVTDALGAAFLLQAKRPDTLHVQTEPATEVDSVVVVAKRGAAATTPDRIFGEAQIDAFGANDIGELVERVNEAAGGRDAPVVIVNGRRVADPAVFLGFPPDALDRVEVLSPLATAQYGANDPSRRVINIVLKARFQGRDVLISAERPTAGGTRSGAADLRRSSIVEMDTSQAGLRISRDSALPAGSRRRYLAANPVSQTLTLRPASTRLAADLAFTKALGDWRGSLGVVFQSQEVRSVLEESEWSKTSRRSLSLTGGASGELSQWSVRSTSELQISDMASSGTSSAGSHAQTYSVALSINRTLIQLPAGPLMADLSGQVARGRVTIRQSDLATRFSTRNDEVAAQLAIPVFRERSSGSNLQAREGGSLTMSFRTSIRSSDAGDGQNQSAGLNWTIFRGLTLSAAASHSKDAPADDQRFAPMVRSDPMLIFDFRTGQSVLISPLSGGDPRLRSPVRRSISIGASAGPFTAWRLSGGINLRQGRASNEISSLPSPTAEIEIAFPDRFQRDADGRLTGVDQRPINIASSSTALLAANISAWIPLKSNAGQGAAGFNLSANAIYRLADRRLLRSGLGEADRLAGDAGGIPRQEITVRMDGRRGAWSTKLATSWIGGYRVRRDFGRDGSGDLKIEGHGTVDLQLGYSFQRPRGSDASASVSVSRRSAGVTVTFDVENVLDARPGAHLEDGRTAPGYGRDDRDPIGRRIKIALTGRF